MGRMKEVASREELASIAISRKAVIDQQMDAITQLRREKEELRKALQWLVDVLSGGAMAVLVESAGWGESTSLKDALGDAAKALGDCK